VTGQHPYQYVVLRCVPRVDREEFVNVGVVVYCEETRFLDCAWNLDEERLRALDPRMDVARVQSGLDHIRAVCRGEPAGGSAGEQPLGVRFGFVKAPRSTVVQPGPVHGGVTDDPPRCLDHLVHTLVG
jgi:hypothetical protein